MTAVSDSTLSDILTGQRTFAMVGASDDPSRPSHGVMAYLQARGFRIIPVNPTLAGRELMGETVYASLADVPGPIDVVDIFRRSDAALGVAKAFLPATTRPIAHLSGPEIAHPAAAAVRATHAGSMAVGVTAAEESTDPERPAALGDRR